MLNALLVVLSFGPDQLLPMAWRRGTINVTAIPTPLEPFAVADPLLARIVRKRDDYGVDLTRFTAAKCVVVMVGLIAHAILHYD